MPAKFNGNYISHISCSPESLQKSITSPSAQVRYKLAINLTFLPTSKFASTLIILPCPLRAVAVVHFQIPVIYLNYNFFFARMPKALKNLIYMLLKMWLLLIVVAKMNKCLFICLTMESL